MVCQSAIMFNVEKQAMFKGNAGWKVLGGLFSNLSLKTNKFSFGPTLSAYIYITLAQINTRYSFLRHETLF